MGVAGTLIFFVCLLLHELGHAVQAKRDDVEIEGITLWVFGGVAKFSSRLPSAAAELRIALAGPAVSLALGVGLLLLAGTVPFPDAVDGVVFWLGSVNLILLAFNMLPAFPLDGGRVARSLLWMRKGDLDQATRSAVALSDGFARVMIGGGIFLVLFAGAVGGVWIALIGWFVMNAARAELAAGAMHSALQDLRMEDVMTPRPTTVPGTMSLATFVDRVFMRDRHATYPVTGGSDGTRVLGLMPFRRVTEVPREEWASKTVGDQMVPLERLVTLAPDSGAEDALPAVAASPLHRALVIEGDRLVGVVSLTDLARLVELRGRPT
jgi:Zn-dependent protease/CBS domain-containing protein